jgi:hypothetical protein
MADLEIRFLSPEQMGREFEEMLKRQQENKYAFQVKIVDVDVAIHEEVAARLGVTLPFHTIAEAEAALRSGVMTPTLFDEEDGTRHEVLAFDPTPIGYSGFQNCATHSLAVTNHGLFEVGRFAAVRFHTAQKEWQWFLHRRLATAEDLAAWQEISTFAPHQLLAILIEEFALPSGHADDERV